MSELLNPLQIAGRLKKSPQVVVKVIVQNDIAAQKKGLRAGLYDLDTVQSALLRYEESQKKPLADRDTK